jgi:hypothetical protein
MVDRGGNVTLRSLPRTENRGADTLLLILYGYRALRNQVDVNTGTLTEAARTSGLQVDRIDRLIATYEHLIRRGGYKRGVRYALNNQGVAHAEGILEEMYG